MAKQEKLSPEERIYREHVREHLFQEALQEPMEYFPHDTNSFNDDALYELKERTGYEGVGMWWTLIELLHSKKGHVYRRSMLGRLAHAMELTEAACEAFLQNLLELGLIDSEMWDRGYVSSKRVERNVETYARSVSRSRLGAAITNGVRA